MEVLLKSEQIGIQYQAGNAGSLASAIICLAGNPEGRREMGRRARALFEHRFEAAKVCAAMIEHLKRSVPAARAAETLLRDA